MTSKISFRSLSAFIQSGLIGLKKCQKTFLEFVKLEGSFIFILGPVFDSNCEAAPAIFVEIHKIIFSETLQKARGVAVDVASHYHRELEDEQTIIFWGRLVAVNQMLFVGATCSSFFHCLGSLITCRRCCWDIGWGRHLTSTCSRKQ